MKAEAVVGRTCGSRFCMYVTLNIFKVSAISQKGKDMEEATFSVL